MMDISLKSVLANYRLFTPVLKNNGKVTKVYTHAGTYALKETSLSDVALATIQNYGQHFQKKVPIMPTAAGQYFYRENNRVFYLTPWYAEMRVAPVNKLKALLEEISHIHRNTSYEVEFKEDWKASYKRTFEEVIFKHRVNLERFIERSEAPVYMSPFQYEVTRCFPIWMSNAQQLEAIYNQWINLIEKEEKTRLVLNHGKLANEHFLYTANGNYFVNLENVHWNTPHYDLLTVLNDKQFGPYLSEVFRVYETNFPLRESERYFLALHLLSLNSIDHLLSCYDNRTFDHELEAVVTLQKENQFLLQRKTFVDELLTDKKESHMSPD